MNSSYSDHFSDLSNLYKVYRPTYPDSVYDYLHEISFRHELAWDCACGSGQATQGLANKFNHVVGTDASQKQLVQARVLPNISYARATAEQTGIQSGSIDLTLVAQAMHWFQMDAFHAEVWRVTRKPGIFAALTYGLFTLDSEADTVVLDFYKHILNGYWPKERIHIDEQYANLPMPSDNRVTKKFSMTRSWTRNQLMGFFSTWSAVRAYRKATGEDPLPRLEADLSKYWKDPGEPRSTRWPLTVISCTIK